MARLFALSFIIHITVKEPSGRNAFSACLDWRVKWVSFGQSLTTCQLGNKRTRFKKTTQQLSSYPVIPANLVNISYLDLVINNPFSGISFTLNSLLHGWKKEQK